MMQKLYLTSTGTGRRSSHVHCLGAGAVLVCSVVATVCILCMGTANGQGREKGKPGQKSGQRQMENLGRGVVAVRQDAKRVFVSWRMLATDKEQVAFNLFRQSGSGAVVKLNESPITQTTHWLDSTAELSDCQTYFVRPIRNGNSRKGAPQPHPESVGFTLPADAPIRQYLSVPLQKPADRTINGTPYSYSPNDASIGDVDGDGEHEIIVKWDPSNARDNSQSGITGNVFLDAYKLDGTHLWRIDLGPNIRAGAHYTQFMVYDLDGDGKAEVACKTADGTVDGVGNTIGDPEADWRNPSGYILSGPEYLTVFDGVTGEARATTAYLPQRHPVAGDNPTPAQIRQVWGDDYGNRLDRFLAAVAYLDGKHPSLVMCRGYYTRTVLVAWDYRAGEITQRWLFDSDDSTGTYLSYRGQGNHNLSIGDIDEDGKDEIVYGSCAIDDDGKGMYSTGRGHGDALHLSDMDPGRPGLEVFSPHETPSLYGDSPLDFRDARTGQLIWGRPGPGQGDVGRGMAADIDPRYLGYEAWGSRGGLYSVKGEQIATGRPSQINFALWWDGDLSRELLDGNSIYKWDYHNGVSNKILDGAEFGAASINGTKANPCLSGDLLGDWREEVIWRNANNEELLIFTTTLPTNYRFPTLLHDPQYRLSLAWQNVAYNQPPHPGFYLGEGMFTDARRVTPTKYGRLETGDHRAEVRIGPNPTTDVFSVRANGAFTYQISDQIGKVWEAGASQNECVAGRTLKAGWYTLKVRTANSFTVVKVVKQ